LVAKINLNLIHNFYSIILPSIAHFNREIEERKLLLPTIPSALLFYMYSQYFGLGILLGATVSGLVFQVSLRNPNSSPSVLPILTAIAYGFLGPVLFFLVGLSASFQPMPMPRGLTSWLLLVNFTGNLLVSVIVVDTLHG